MKLPNGYGSVYKLSGKRRNPWGARKTIGWEYDPVTEKSKQKYAPIGYFKTRQEALNALAKYNMSPYDLESNKTTFSEVYTRWSESHFQTIVPSAVRTWKSAYKYCAPLYNMKMRDIRVNDLESAIKNADVGDTTKARMKSMFNLIYKYALKHDLADKDYAALCDSVKKAAPKITRKPFTNDEEKILWDNLNFPFVDMVLIGIYSGWRPQELSTLRISDIDLNKNTMMGGSKTDAGRNRIVPIHPKIKPLVESLYDANNEYLFNDNNGQQGTFMTYDKYRGRFLKIADRFGFDHKPHDTRHTFITKSKNVDMNEYILKLIVGHSIEDVTEKIYTHRTLEDLQLEMNKIQ